MDERIRNCTAALTARRKRDVSLLCDLREAVVVTDALSYDADAFELRRDGELVELEPQAVAVAAYLIENSHRLISKEELLDEVWGDRFVSESALTTRIKQIRRGLGDDGVEQRIVKTVYGKGYRFIGEITMTTSPPSETGVPTDHEHADRGRPHHRLPRQRNGVVGREADLTKVLETVARHRLTTLIGVGGVGKTTLAITAGHGLLESFPDGVWFVDLATVSDAEQVPAALANAAGLSLRNGPILDQIGRILAVREVLYIVDNCEHLNDAVAATIDELLDTTTEPRFLLTSREPSGVTDEARVVVKPLSSEPDGPAVELLEASLSRFGVADLDRTKAAEVCRELDGLPLAIELAAAQLRHLSIDDLAARLDQRFDLLVRPRGDRHASLTAVLDGTWASISDSERELLRQLAACPVPLPLDDIVEIMDSPEHTTIASLGRLVDCSLLSRSAHNDGAYRMLETVRAYAVVDDADRVRKRRDRLANWCLERVGDDIVTQTFDFGLVRWCRAHAGVLDAAELHLGADRATDAAVLVSAQGLTLHLDDGSRAAQVLGRIDQHLGRIDDPLLRARLHIAGTFGAMAVRDSGLIAAHGSAAVDEARRGADPCAHAIALVLQSWSLVREPVRAIALATEAADIAAAAEDRRSFDLAEGYRAWHLALMGHRDQAMEVARAVVERTPTDPGYDTSCAAAALASCLAPHDPAGALRVFETHLDGSEFPSMMANRLLLASAHAAAGNVLATAQIVLSVSRRVERAGQHAFPDAFVPIAMLATALGDVERARIYTCAVRRSERPTQSLQITCLYQQLRTTTGMTDVDLSGTVDQVAVDALDWLGSLTETSP